MLFSIVIPVYNEAVRIQKSIHNICDFFYKHTDHSVEIIFVNDGSTDGTPDILNSYKKSRQFSVISYQKNRGKGYAVKQGALAARGDWIIFFDVDLATPLKEFDHMVTFMESTDQIIIGSRRLVASLIEKSESAMRVFLGQGFTALSNILVPEINDFTCGFKCFSSTAARKIFPLARIDRWGFDTELLYIAKLKNIKIRQMPIKWAHDNDSRVRVLPAIWSSLAELIQIKWNQIKGLY